MENAILAKVRCDISRRCNFSVQVRAPLVYMQYSCTFSSSWWRPGQPRPESSFLESDLPTRSDSVGCPISETISRQPSREPRHYYFFRWCRGVHKVQAKRAKREAKARRKKRKQERSGTARRSHRQSPSSDQGSTENTADAGAGAVVNEEWL